MHADFDVVTVKSCDCYCTFPAVACNVCTVCATFRLLKKKKREKKYTLHYVCSFVLVSAFIHLSCTHSRVLCIILEPRLKQKLPRLTS